MRGLRNPRTPKELLVARLTLVTLVVIAIDLVAAFGFYLLERHASGSEVTNYEQSFFWTTSQPTSVSSSIRNPITTAGHFLAIGLDVIAVGVVTVLVATIVQHLHIVSPRRAEYFRQRATARGGEKSSGG
ncbi:MAG TPA: hypothetical protein VIZ91_05610 [Solirubrobacterales bacterium]